MLGAIVVTMAACTDSNTPERITTPSPQPGVTSPTAYTAGTDIRTPGNYLIQGAVWTAVYPYNVGTGNIDPFLSVQNSPNEKGFNTDGPLDYNTTRPSYTDALPLNAVPSLTETVGSWSGQWREFILDANEANSGVDAQFSIDSLNIWVCHDPAVKTLTEAQFVTLQASPSTYSCVSVYKLNGDASLRATDAGTSGSGKSLDYRILVPKSYFGTAANNACAYDMGAGDCGYYVLVYTEMGMLGGDYVTGSTFEEFSTIQRPVYSISGTKYNDHNANSTRDTGDEGLAGWTISAYDGSNNLVVSAVTDGSGNFVLNGLDNGTYLVCETPQSGWIESDPSNAEGVSCSAILGAAARGYSVTVTGANVTGILFGNYQPSSLKIVKKVTNDNGGTATYTAFGITTDAGTLTPWTTSGSAPTITYTSNKMAVTPGTYHFAEIDVAGYTEGTWSCTGAAAITTTYNNGSVTVPAGTDVVCTITNNDTPPSLTLDKITSYTHGGTRPESDWTLSAAGPTPISGPGASGHTDVVSGATFQAGTYTLSESGGPYTGYVNGTTYSCVKNGGAPVSSNSITLALGDVAVCSITNTDQGSSLQLVKVVVNDNGGTATVTDFTIVTNAGTLTPWTPTGSAPTITYTSVAIPVNAGNYTFSEANLPGYNEGTWSCTGGTQTGTAYNAGAVTIGLGQTVVCTITNNDIPPVLTLDKVVSYSYGGTRPESDWTLSAAGPSPLSGTGASGHTDVVSGATFKAGTYTLSESGTYTGYQNGTTYSCVKNHLAPVVSNTIVLAPADTAVCTITNTDKPGSITIVKNVKGQGGTFNFPTTSSTTTTLPNPISITVASDNTNSATYNNLKAGTYTVQETIPADYTLTGLSCTAGGVTNYPTGSLATITLPLGGTVTCTYENTHTLVTRTQGFWATHLWIAQAVWNGGTVGGNTFPGIADKTLCGQTLDVAKLMGGFWASIPKTTSGAQRSDVSRAKMQLLQQLLAAILNHEAFGSSPSGDVSIAQATAAFCTSTDLTTIRNAMSAMAYFNESGDSGLFTPGVSANVKDAKALANLLYWDYLN